MARLFLALTFFSTLAQAQIFNLPFSDEKTQTLPKLEKHLKELESLEISKDFEERYRGITVEIEKQLDLKRGECAENQVKSEKQKCFRSVVSYHKRFLERSFDLKKDYLKSLHEQQLNALNQARTNALKELERQF